MLLRIQMKYPCTCVRCMEKTWLHIQYNIHMNSLAWLFKTRCEQKVSWMMSPWTCRVGASLYSNVMFYIRPCVIKNQSRKIMKMKHDLFLFLLLLAEKISRNHGEYNIFLLCMFWRLVSEVTSGRWWRISREASHLIACQHFAVKTERKWSWEIKKKRFLKDTKLNFYQLCFIQICCWKMKRKVHSFCEAVRVSFFSLPKFHAMLAPFFTVRRMVV